MGDVRDPATDQQLPVVNDRPFVQDLVVADIEQRKAHGIRKYGTALQSGNGRDMLLDAYEEALDLAIYLRGAIDERDRESSDTEAAVCGADDGYGQCDRPVGHDGCHGHLVGGGGDPLGNDPELWFAWGNDETPGYRSAHAREGLPR